MALATRGYGPGCWKVMRCWWMWLAAREIWGRRSGRTDELPLCLLHLAATDAVKDPARRGVGQHLGGRRVGWVDVGG